MNIYPDELGEHLYRSFWIRQIPKDAKDYQARVDAITPYSDQAVAIVTMWNNIAQDALNILGG